MIKLGFCCEITVIDFGYTLPELLQTEKWTKSLIEKYFIASKDWKVANSYGGTCHNQNCKAYQKLIQFFLFAFSEIKKNGSKNYS